MSKVWWKSRTIWLNVLTVLSALAAAANEFLNVLQVSLSPETYAVSLFVIGALNVFLRTITTQGITAKPK